MTTTNEFLLPLMQRQQMAPVATSAIVNPAAFAAAAAAKGLQPPALPPAPPVSVATPETVQPTTSAASETPVAPALAATTVPDVPGRAHDTSTDKAAKPKGPNKMLDASKMLGMAAASIPQDPNRPPMIGSPGLPYQPSFNPDALAALLQHLTQPAAASQATPSLGMLIGR